MIDAAYWQELGGLDPRDVCQRSLATYDEKRGGYVLTMVNEDMLIVPETRNIERISEPIHHHRKDPDFNEELVSVLYLLKARDIPFTGELVAGNEIAGGDFFFRGLHALPTDEIEETFGNNTQGFMFTGVMLGGKKVDFGDAAIEIPALPRIPLTYVLWAGDEEFPARVSILFDKTAGQHLPLDVLLTLIHLTTNLLCAIAP